MKLMQKFLALMLLAVAGAAIAQTYTSNNSTVTPTFNVISPVDGQCMIYTAATQTWGASGCTGNLTTALATPPAIGGTTPAAGAFTTLSASTSFKIGTTLLNSATAPTVTSGLGTAPVVTAHTTAAFKVVVDSAGTPTTTTVLGMPAATTAWACMGQDLTSAVTARESASTTTTATFTWTSAPTASDVLVFNCGAF